MTQPAFTKMYLKGKQPLYGYTVNSNGTEAAVAQAQPARRPSHLKRPRTEPRLVAGAWLEALQLRGVGAKLGGHPPAQAGRTGATGSPQT